MQDEFFAKLQEEAEEVDLSSVPSEENLARLRSMAQKLWETDVKVRELEASLETTKSLRTKLAHRDLPDLMAQIGQDRIGLPDAGEHGVDLVSEMFVHANIPRDWDDDRRNAAFDLLDRKGDGALIKNVLTFQFDRGDHEKVKAFLDVLQSDEFADLMRDRLSDGRPRMVLNDLAPPPPVVEMTVPWNTLTKYVREQVLEGTLHEPWMAKSDPPIDPIETLGATVGTVVKIKPRKG